MSGLVGTLLAQGNEALLTTVGTTVERDGRHYAYLLWQPGEGASTFGSRFAIHRKSGDADSGAPFSLLGSQTLQTSPNTVRAMLELGAKIDRAAALAPTRIDGLYREITLRQGEAPAAPDDPTLDAAAKLVFLLQSASEDPRTLARLFFLGRAHPGVMLALGHAFMIEVPAGVSTFEVRETDFLGDDRRVVGRVTLDPAAPIELDAPASPVPVPHPVAAGSQYPVSPKDHLNVRLRWGVGPGLRAEMPHAFGFDVFRVKAKVAENLGWDASPPSAEEMLDALSGHSPQDPDPDVSQANALPVLVGELLTPAEAGDLSDLERIDFSDDGIWHAGAEGAEVRRPFEDGESFYYFVAARGITGAPGLLSPGTLVTMCDTLPPAPPEIVSVLSNFVRPANPADWTAQAGSQFLQVKIRQAPEGNPAEEAAGYYVYRWSASGEHLENLGNPVVNRIGYVAHQPGETFVTFNDNGAGAPTLATHPDTAVWYTARAVGKTACSRPIFSGHSGPIAGFLRDFRGPDRPDGDFVICRQLPQAIYGGRRDKKPEDLQLPPEFIGIALEIRRQLSVITEADVTVETRQADNSWLVVHQRRHLFQNSDDIIIPLPIREPAQEDRPLRLSVSAVTAHGLVSSPAQAAAFNSKGGLFATYEFSLTANQDCRAISTVPENPPVHESHTPDGLLIPIEGFIGFPVGQGVREWRVYRRIGTGGPLTLIAKAEGDAIPNPGTWTDEALPLAAGTQVCYFGQTFDQNANPSPLVPLGCTTLTNPDLPTPMLSAAEITGVDGDLVEVELEWFCDPVGVERFEVLVAREGGGTPEISGLSDVVAPGSLASISPDFPDLAFFRFQTPRLAGVLGSGPAFKFIVRIPPDARHFFAVRACGPGAPEARTCGSASNVVSARWVDLPGPAQPVIPWPARPLPGTFNARLPIDSFTQGEGPLWPIVMPVDFTYGTGILIGLARHAFETTTGKNGGKETQLFSPEPPEAYLFKVRKTAGDVLPRDSLMPFVLYRYQLPSSLYPSARANLVPCTPLIDRISWDFDSEAPNGGAQFRVRDPFIEVVNFNNQMPIPVDGLWTETTPPLTANPAIHSPLPPYLEDATGMILLRDPLPVTTGARYRYLIVQFDDRSEIERVIPLQPVQQ